MTMGPRSSTALTVTAKFEDGVLRPDQPLPLAPRQRVTLMVQIAGQTEVWPESLANFWGLAPGCRNSGEKQQRIGSITKEGSQQVRFLLGQMVLHVLRRDPQIRHWYREVRKRRGSKIARVAMMRRLATIIWHMVKHRQAYQVGGPPRTKRPRPATKQMRPATNSV